MSKLADTYGEIFIEDLLFELGDNIPNNSSEEELETVLEKFTSDNGFYGYDDIPFSEDNVEKIKILFV